MEGVSANVYKGMKGYWRRKGYQRIDGSGKKRMYRRRMEVAKMGEGSTGSGNKKRFWRFKMKPKLKFFKMGSPKKFFVKLRDAYVKMMLGFANSRVCSATGGGGYGTYGAGVDGVGGLGGFGTRPMKEYEQKMIVEIYKSIVMAQAQGAHLVHRECDGGKLGSDIVCQR